MSAPPDRSNAAGLARLACALVVASSLSASGAKAGAAAAAAITCRPGSKPMARVDLYFGAGPGGPRAWTRFLAHVVTPRFPDGLTNLEASGQWRDRQGLTKEATHVLVIFYDPDATSEARIEAIRRLYDRQFRQKSVLRADSTSCVSF